MIIKYNIEQMKRILRDFSCVTGLALSIRDTEFHPLYTYAYRESSFCQAVHEAEGGKDKCLCSDQEIMQKSARSKKFESHICHAGVLDSAVPIIKNGIIAGYIIVGRIRTAPNLKKDYERLSWLGLEYEKLNQMDQEISYYNEEQIQAIADMISYLLFESAIEVDYPPLVKDAEAYIDLHLQEELSVELLCAVLGVSKNLLYKSFHEAFGCSVNQYVIDQRMKKAKELLKNTNEPVYVVAEQCGFASEAYFCRRFKKETGYSPLEFRKWI